MGVQPVKNVRVHLHPPCSYPSDLHSANWFLHLRQFDHYGARTSLLCESNQTLSPPPHPFLLEVKGQLCKTIWVVVAQRHKFPTSFQ